MKQKITFVAPTPPPYAGPEISTAHLLSSPLNEEFELIHIRSNLKTENSQKGAFTFAALARQLVVYYRIVQTRRRGSRAIYVLIAVNVLGFLKDAGSIWLGRLLGMRVIAHMKGATLPSFYQKSPRPLRWFILATVRRLDVMIVQARPIREAIVTTFGLDPSKLPIIPNMVEEAPNCERGRPGHNLLFMGHLSIGKGFGDLLSVMEDVLSEFPDAILRCAGEPKSPARDYVAQSIGAEPSREEMRLIDRAMRGDLEHVHYLGPIHDGAKEKLLCQSDIFVLPSYSESFPLAVLEAMSHGCAVVASTVGALPEMINHGKEGILIGPGDRRALSLAIRTLLSDEALRLRLGYAGQAKAQGSYSVEKVVPLYVDVFRGVLPPASPPVRGPADPQSVAWEILHRARASDWRDFDPYDGLSGFGSKLPETAVLARRLVTQIVMRTPPRLRWIAGVGPHQEAYSAGILLSTASLLAEKSSMGLIDELVTLLGQLRVPNTAGWGYGFPVTTRAASYGPETPNAISTSFAALGLADAVEAGGAESPASGMLAEAVEWLASSLWEERWSAFRYHPGNDNLIYNASILCGLALARSSALIGTGHVDMAQRALARVIDAQKSDGSWPYGEGPHLDWVDNHHTAFVLKALLLLPEAARSDRWIDALDRGVTFFIEHLLTDNGAPLAGPGRLYPLDSLAAGQAVETLALAATELTDRGFRERAEAVFNWTEAHLRRRDGRYRFRSGRFGSWPGAYLRWGEAHIALGAARLSSLHR